VESAARSKSVVLMGRRNTGYDDSSNYMGGGTRGWMTREEQFK
jgi:hypothetical protein